MGRTKRVPINLSLHQAVRQWAIYEADKPALITDNSTISYRILQNAVRNCQRQLAGLRLPRQTPIGILADDKPSFVAATCAVLALGCIPVFVNLGLAPPVIRSMILDAGCRAVVMDEAQIHVSALPKRAKRISVPKTETLRESGLQDMPPTERYVDDVWGIIYSSGTTGKPKGIVRSDFSMLNELIGWCLEMPLLQSSVSYIGRPIYYTGGLVITAATLLVGGSVILPSEWSVDSYRSLIQANEVDVAFLIPDQIRELGNAKEADGGRWPAPRRILAMGGIVGPSLKRFIVGSLGCSCIESWGNSEGLGTITSAADVETRPNSIGRPFLSDELLIVDEAGNRLPPGKVGRVAGRADSVLTRYQNRSDLNEELIRGRLVISEDLGYTDEHGYFYLMGRVTQRIIRNGTPIFTSDIESAFRSVRGVRDVAVAGLPHSTEGEVPVAAVVVDEKTETTPLDILVAANGQLSKDQRVGRLYVVAELPHNPAGKIEYDMLKEKIFSRTPDYVLT